MALIGTLRTENAKAPLTFGVKPHTKQSRTGVAMEQSLVKFLEAQENEYLSALHELQAGAKRGHWMWYIFPQMRGLGQTEKSWRFGIQSADEAKSYLNHPILGSRLIECTKAVLALRYRKLQDIFPPPDDLKFGSCMTLFALQESAPPEFQIAIDRFLGGRMDVKTVLLLQSPPVP